ncbi:MAG: M43 family zinc metalloprotease [Flavisolibacter sp.]
MEYLEQRLQNDPTLRKRFEKSRSELNATINKRIVHHTARLGATVYVPVVFHVVLKDLSLVTYDQLLQQLDVLNEDFSGSNKDSVNIPVYFKPLFGKSKIQFCLAKTNPNGGFTNGIDIVKTERLSFGLDDSVKHASTGGANGWDPDHYLNVWICSLSGALGYSTFPQTTLPGDQGVVIDYGTLPGGDKANSNYGKALTHEAGHYFNLYHIWGDDGNACWGTDYVYDTPNQSGPTLDCNMGIQRDNCTSGGNGIMYQNYMDYTNEECTCLFTNGQVDRMESTILSYRASLLSSTTCQAPVLNDYDAQLVSVQHPTLRICNTPFTPQVIIRNKGSEDLFSLQITTVIDNGSPVNFQWKGQLKSYDTAIVNLKPLNATAGTHKLVVYVSNPDYVSDQDTNGDTLQGDFQYFGSVTSVNESFENTGFPPSQWNVVNPDHSVTWERNVNAGKTGVASTVSRNFNYNYPGQVDELQMPLINIPAGPDTAFLSFQVAAAAQVPLNSINSRWDTLEVLISKDCGMDYYSIYKKWGQSLVTDTLPVTDEFVPSSTQWRKDSIDLSGFIGNNNLLISFRNTTGAGNDIYLDDIRLRTSTVNPTLKKQGFLISPNPTHDVVRIQVYPLSNNLKSIELFNAVGQAIAKINVTSQASTYVLNLNSYPKGMYTVRAIFINRIVTRKIIRL